jgi:DNA-binding NarL/FixJ family response regulator
MMGNSRPRILFVDDERPVLDGLSRALRSWQSAWDMMFLDQVEDCLTEQRRQPFDVAVVDITMPGMSGLELIPALAAIHPATLAIILTGATDIATAAAAINEANVFRFYTKPCAAALLAGGIEQALEEARTRIAQRNSSTEAAISMATLDRMPTGVIVVDNAPKVLFTNKQGAELLSAHDGMSIGPSGLVRTNKPKETAELSRLITQAIDGGDSGVPHALSLSREDSDRPLSVVVAPLPPSSAGIGQGARVAVLLVSAPERQKLPSVETVSRLFDLTDAEARLAIALGEGNRIEDAAGLLGITVSSARTYLKRVFSKTDVTRQAELVRLLLAAPVLADLGGVKPVGRQTH